MSEFRAFTDPLMGIAGPVVRLPRPENATLADLIALVPLEDEGLRPHLRVRLNGELIDAGWHRLIRPKDMAYVTVLMPVHGGGDSGKLLSSIAAIALIGASLFVGAFGVPFLGSAFAAGSVGANLVAGGLSIAASLLLQGLSPKPARADGGATNDVGVASAQNSFELGGYLQRVAGTRKVSPKMILPPWTAFEGDDQVVYAAYGLAGPHAISDVRVGYTAVEDDPNFTTEIREGFASDAALTLITNTVIESQVGLTMTDFVSISSAEASVQLDTSLSVYTPQWHRLETKRAPDAVIINFSLPGGLFNLTPSNPDSDTQVAGVTALRVRFRPSGSALWSNCPEFVIRGRRGQSAIRLALKFVWCPAASIPSVTAPVANWKGWSWVYSTVNDNAGVWSADTYFTTTSAVDAEDSQHLVIYLDEAEFPQGQYEFELIRGATVHDAAWNSSTHTLNGTLPSFFDVIAGSPPTLTLAPNKYVRELQIDSIQSVFDEYPFDFTTQPTAVLVLKAKNRQINQVSCIASGYAADWNGTSWVADQLTANPASWYREVLTGALNAEPVDLSLVSMPEVQTWHAWCKARSLEVNAIFEQQPVTEVLSGIAQAGFARPGYGAPYRPVIDRRRAPVGLVTLRNTSGWSFEKPFARLAHALRVTFADAAQDFEVREIIVYADGYNADGSGGLTEASRFEAISYATITAEAQAIKRAKRDLRTGRHRSRLLSWTMDVEHLEFQMGDLLLVETDILGQQGGRGRVVAVTRNGSGQVTGLTLDEAADFTAADAASAARGVVLRLDDGTLLTAAVAGGGADPSAVRFTTPFAMPTSGGLDLIGPDTLVATGTLSSVTREILAWDIQPGPDLTAQITGIDYADDAIYGLSAFSSAFSSDFGSGLY